MASPPEANSSDPKTTRIIILKIGTGHGLLKKSSTGTPANKTSYPKAPTAAGVKRERDKEEQVEPTPERKKAKISLQTCAICAVQLATSQFPEHPHAKSVDRGACSEVCLICFDKHIKAEITNKSFKIVNCPQCSQTLTELEVRKLTEHTDTYQKYAGLRYQSSKCRAD